MNGVADLRSVSDAELVQTYQRFGTLKKIARHYRVAVSAVYKRLTDYQDMSGVRVLRARGAHMKGRNNKHKRQPRNPPAILSGDPFEQIKIIAELYQKYPTMTAVADLFDISPYVVRQKIKQYEQITGQKLEKNLTPQVSRAVALYREHGTLEQAGDIMGVTRERVRQLIKKYENRTGETISRAAHHADALIKKGRQLVELYREGWNMTEIGELTGLSPSNVSFHIRKYELLTGDLTERHPLPQTVLEPTEKMLDAVELWQQGMLTAEIGQRLQVANVPVLLNRFELITGVILPTRMNTKRRQRHLKKIETRLLASPGPTPPLPATVPEILASDPPPLPAPVKSGLLPKMPRPAHCRKA